MVKMWIANLTKISYEFDNCLGNITNINIMTQDCYSTTERCCEEIIGISSLNTSKCYGDSRYLCNPSSVSLELFGYIIQIFGVLFLFSVFSLFVFYICKQVYPKVPDNPLLVRNSIQSDYEKI